MGRRVRFVTHADVDETDIREAARVVHGVVKVGQVCVRFPAFRTVLSGILSAAGWALSEEITPGDENHIPVLLAHL